MGRGLRLADRQLLHEIDRWPKMRTRVSFLNGRGHEFGFVGTFGAQNDEVTFNIFNINVVDAPIVPTDMYKHVLSLHDQVRRPRTLLGRLHRPEPGDLRQPTSACRCRTAATWSAASTTSCRTTAKTITAPADESWNLAMNIVLYFGRMKEGIHNTPFRPLFNVADNGNVMLQQ